MSHSPLGSPRATSGRVRAVSLLLLLSLLAAMIAACAPVGAPADGGAAAGARPSLTVWVPVTFTPDADAYHDELMTQWAAENNVDISIARMSQDERRPRWQTATETKQFPDCAAIELNDLPKFIVSGDLVETTAAIERLNQQAGGLTDGAFLAGRTADGRHWSIPSFSSTEIYYVRSDKAAEVGMDLPDTWEEAIALAAAINAPEDNFWGMGMQVGTPSWDSEVQFTAILWSYGGKTWDEEGKPAIDSPETRQVLDLIKGIWDAGLIPPDATTWDDAGNNRAYQSEIVGMTLNTGSILNYLKNDDPELGEKTAAIPVPGGPAGRFISGYYYQWGVFNTSPHADLCLQMLEWMLSPENLQGYYEGGGGNMLPVYKDMLEHEMWQDPQRKVLADMVSATRPQGYPGLTTPWVLDAWMDHTMVKMLNRVIVDGWSNDEAIAEADAALWKWYNDWQALLEQ